MQAQRQKQPQSYRVQQAIIKENDYVLKQEKNQRQTIIDLSNLSIGINRDNNFNYLIQSVYKGSQNNLSNQKNHKDQLASKIQENLQHLVKEKDQQHYHKKQQQKKQQTLINNRHDKQQSIVVRLQLVQVQPLTVLHRKQIDIFTLYCGLGVKIKAILKLSKFFNQKQLNYFMQIQAAKFYYNNMNNNQQTIQQRGSVTVRTVHQLERNQSIQSACLTHIIQITFPVLLQYQGEPITDRTPITLILGNNHQGYDSDIQNSKQNNEQSKQFPFIVSNFTAYKQTHQQTQKSLFNSQSNQQSHLQSMQRPIIQNLSIDNDYSYPLIDSLQLINDSNTKHTQQLKQAINNLQQYQSPKVQFKDAEKLLYICHDMKGGYIEDINTYSPFLYTNQQKEKVNNHKKTHSYRFNYMPNTKVFNYFSHYPITIPPKSYRKLCKRYNTLCLGTFIVEPNQLAIDQNEFMTEQFALKLIYIAKKAQFDGYLINIEVEIRDMGKLLAWLQYLTKEINLMIPNSMIVWYDSIIMNGQIMYQNQLNPNNLPFYQSTNAIFTNYWWNQSSLNTSMLHKIQNKPIFIGNDCWGRNTYGGGKYDLYNAVNKIQSVSKNNQLSIALFAPAYTYEDNAEHSMQLFNQNQLKMYHGYQCVNKPITKWKVTQNGGQGWKQQGQWAVSSHQLCKRYQQINYQRQALIDISAYKGRKQTLHITFSCTVKGTAPNFADHYMISLQLLDYKNHTVYEEKFHPKTEATENQQRVQIRMEVYCQMITDNVCLKLLQQGKDVENWGGNYGTRFKDEMVSLSFQNSLKNWIQKIPVQPVQLSNQKGYLTFFNKGLDENFHYFGKQFKQSYNSLMDYDFPPVFVLNDASNLQVQHKDGFVGGSCLKFTNTNKIMLNHFVVFNENKKQIQKELKFTVLIKVKNTSLLFIRCGKQNKMQIIRIKPDDKNVIIQNKNVAENGWKSYQLQISFIDNGQQRQFQIQAAFGSDSGLIGCFGVFPVFKQGQIQNKKISYQLTLKLNQKPKYIFPYEANISIQSQSFTNITKMLPQRFLLKIGQFAGFLYLDKNLQNNKQFKDNNTQTNNHQQQKRQKSYKLQGFLKDIPILKKKAKQFSIQIIDTNAYSLNTLMKQSISFDKLNKLTQDKIVEIQFQL